MDVASLYFLGFSAVVAVLYNAARPVAWRNSILLLANFAFLTTLSSNWKDFVPFAVFMALGYAGVRLLQSPASRFTFLPVLIGYVFLFVWLKQYTFIPESLFLHFGYITVGLSYIFFRVMHLIVETRDGNVPDRVGLVSYLIYTLNFTTLIAGPIQRYRDFAASQLNPIRPALSVRLAAMAFERIAIGLFKVRVLSLVLSTVQTIALNRLSSAQPLRAKLLTAAVAASTYPLYLYFNFSGYVDLMIGVARFIRLDLPENFDHPFSSTSFIEFWSRWHITLSNWLKTYVYMPLVKTLMLRFPSPLAEPLIGVAAFFVTFFLVGVWHGRTSEFLMFGLLQGFGVSLNKLYQVFMVKALGRRRLKALDLNRIYLAFARGLTFTYFTFTLLWFWSSWSQLRKISYALTRAQAATVLILVWIASTAALALWQALRTSLLSVQWEGRPAILQTPARAAWAAYLTGVTISVTNLSSVAVPILYRIF